MGSPAGAVASLVRNDPMVGSNFWLEIQGAKVTLIQEVNGLDLEIEVVETTQAAEGGKWIVTKTMGQPKIAGELTLKRLAPLNVGNDEIWKWFNEIRNKGIGASDRTGLRKEMSLV